METTLSPAGSGTAWKNLGRLTQAAVAIDFTYVIVALSVFFSMGQHGDFGLWAVVLIFVLPASCIAPLIGALALWVLRNRWLGMLAFVVNLAWLCMPAFFPHGISIGLWILNIGWSSWPYFLLGLPSMLTLAALAVMLLRRRPTPSAGPRILRRFATGIARLAITLAALGAAIIAGAALLSPTECIDTLEARLTIQSRLPPEQAATLRPEETLDRPRNCTHMFTFTRRGERVFISFLPDFIHGTKFFDLDDETYELMHRR